MTDNPVAWLVSRNGEPCYVSLKLVDASMERNRLELVSTGTPAIELIPLYPSPTLTAEEREAVEWCVEMATVHATECDDELAALRNLLERLT